MGRVRFGGFQRANLTPIWVLLAVNFMVFLASLIAQERVFALLGLMPYTFSEEPWTIVTAMFVHASFWHIFGNMLMLYFFGAYLLGLVGEGKFLLLYFVGGLAGNIVFLWLGPPLSTAVGASGALYAVMGALAVMRPRMKVYLWFMIPIDLWIVVILGALIISQGIAWQAHLGGLATGLVAGYFFRKREGFHWR